MGDARDPRQRAEALRWLGEAEAARGRLRAALAAFTEATRRDGSAWLARVRRGDVLSAMERHREADAVWSEVISAYNDERIALDDVEGLEATARAAAALGAYRDANETFGRAARLAPEGHALRLAWAELLASKHASGEAASVVREVLRLDPRHPRAWLMEARIAVDELRLEDAERALAQLFAEAPDLPGAHVVRAGILLRGHDFEGAAASLETALALRPGDREALAVRGAMAFVRDDVEAFERVRREASASRRAGARFFVVVGGYADWEHRYPELVRLAREAARLDPDLASAHAALGFNLLRLGRDEEGLAALRTAWDLDPYDVRVYNTLKLYERVLPRHYEQVRISDRFDLRLPKGKREVLLQLVPPLLQRAWRTMAPRYPRRPTGRVRVELYPDPEHFAVRTAGVPRIAVQGVCFGPVVTALAPGAGEFDWGQVLWHELAHVFHLEASGGRVPRWFTEGLAEWEAARANPRWRRRGDELLERALRRGSLPSFARLDRAFTRAGSVEEALLAYTLAHRAVAFLVDRFGADRVVGLLVRFGRGRSVAEVLEEHLGEPVSSLDAAFAMREAARLRARRRGWSPNFPGSSREDPALRGALEALRRGRKEAAVEAAVRALGSSAPEVSLHAAVLLGYLSALQGEERASGVPEVAVVRLRRAVEGDRDGVLPRVLLAREALRGGRLEEAVAHLRAAHHLDPDAEAPLLGLLRIARQVGREGLELESLEGLHRRDPASPGPWRRWFDRLFETARWEAACRQGAHTPMLAPFDFDAWAQTAEACTRGGEPGRARGALRIASLVLGRSEAARSRLDAIRRLVPPGQGEGR